jgi:hypothetical protein
MARGFGLLGSRGRMDDASLWLLIRVLRRVGIRHWLHDSGTFLRYQIGEDDAIFRRLTQYDVWTVGVTPDTNMESESHLKKAQSRENVPRVRTHFLRKQALIASVLLIR